MTKEASSGHAHLRGEEPGKMTKTGKEAGERGPVYGPIVDLIHWS